VGTTSSLNRIPGWHEASAEKRQVERLECERTGHIALCRVFRKVTCNRSEVVNDIAFEAAGQQQSFRRLATRSAPVVSGCARVGCGSALATRRAHGGI